VVSYSIFEPPEPPADRVDRAASLVFVKDGFSWPAALFAPLWMLAHRLWWPLLGYMALSAALQLAGPAVGVNWDWLALAFAAMNLVVGLEAAPLRASSLGRFGWKNLGAVTGKSLLECERHFFAAWLPAQPVIAPLPERATGRGRWWRRPWPRSLPTSA
jgi:hypothetical protein